MPRGEVSLVALYLISMLMLSAPAGAAVRALTIEGDTVEGRFAGVRDDGVLLVDQQGQSRVLPIDSLMHLTWTKPPPPASGPSDEKLPVIHFDDGSRLTGRIDKGDARHVSLATSLRGNLTVPFSDLAAVRFPHEASAEADEAFDRAMREPHATEDVLIVVRGGRVTTLRGVTESLDSSGGRFKWRGRSVTIDPQQAYGLVMATGVQERATAPALCELVNGDIIAGRMTGGDGDQIDVQQMRLSAEGAPATVKLPVAQLTEIRFSSDRVKFVDELAPTEYVYEPFAATRWPWRPNRSVANRPIRLGGRTYDRGIGVHAKATLVYDLPEGYTRLAGVIGIDDAVRPRGDVIFRVIADDREVYASGPVTGRSEPQSILVPVAGAGRLKLVVEFGNDLDIGDHADWANLRLLK